MIKISKYEFTDEASALSKIAALPHSTDEDGNNYATHSHTVVKLGYIAIEPGQYDSEGNEIQAPVLYDKYCVDVMWKDLEETDEDGNVSIDHPYGWKSYAIDLDNEGVHSFFDVEYLDNKM
tara:strand:- start:537 stop:899 length:363 start_codon:yes stop_codon:yes gene_type:complete